MNNVTNITDSFKTNKGLKKLRDKFNEDPVAVILVFAAAATATAKIIDAMSAAQGRKAYAKQINHKVRK